MAQQYVQGGIFGGLTSQPLGWGDAFGTTPAQTPSISPVEGLPGSTIFGGVQSSGSAAQTIGVLPTGAQTGQVTPSASSAPAASTAATPASAGSGPFGLPGDWFYRVILVILGLIFVAVGLHLFAPSVVPDVRRVLR